MSPVFAKQKCLQGLLDFLFLTDDSVVSSVEEKVENSDHEKSSDGGV